MTSSPRSLLLLVTGTGTSIGKTHLAVALVHAVQALGHSAAGFKPIESGVGGPEATDFDRLRDASTFHVKPSIRPVRALPAPISPHLAAADAGTTIELSELFSAVTALQSLVDVLVLELPGGLFSPLSPTLVNGDVARVLRPTATWLVAPDRLGVLHDVGAASRAAAADGIGIDGIALAPPAAPDASTGRNFAELPLVTRVVHRVTIPRVAAPEALAADASVATILKVSLHRVHQPAALQTMPDVTDLGEDRVVGDDDDDGAAPSLVPDDIAKT